MHGSVHVIHSVYTAATTGSRTNTTMTMKDKKKAATSRSIVPSSLNSERARIDQLSSVATWIHAEPLGQHRQRLLRVRALMHQCIHQCMADPACSTRIGFELSNRQAGRVMVRCLEHGEACAGKGLEVQSCLLAVEVGSCVNG